MTATLDSIGIGSTVWVFVADDRRHGSGEWKPFVVIGETRVSWVIQYKPWFQIKFPKKPDHRGLHFTQELRKGYGDRMQVLFSERAVADDEWRGANRRHVARAVEVCADATVLRKIAEMLGYKPEERKA